MDAMRWSLNELYESFDDTYKRDLKRLQELVIALDTWSSETFTDGNTDVAPVLKESITRLQTFETLFSRLYDYAELVLSVDAGNADAQKYVDMLQQVNVGLTPVMTRFQVWLGGIDDLERYLSEDDVVADHRFFVLEQQKKSKYLLSEKEEVLVSRMKNTGSNAWTKLWNTVTSKHRVRITTGDVEREEPLPVIRNMAYDADGDTRKRAYEAELASYEQIEEPAAAALNSIKGEVLTLTEQRGYESPLDMTLFNSRMDRETLDAMLSVMREYLPVFRTYYRKKAQMLGHDGSLPFYDLFAPVGTVAMRFTWDEARTFIVDNFRSFSEKLANFADEAFERRWIDAEPRSGKRGGAFCANLHSIGESRILANFDGGFSNVRTIAHELGHAYHGLCLRDGSVLNSHYPMPLAETASIFCETIIHNAALERASNDEAVTILEGDLASAGQVIVDIYSRFLFESRLFEARTKGPLSVKEIRTLMLQAQESAYGDAIDTDVRHPWMWVNKPHYYYADHNFYNFPYAFGLLFARGLYAVYKDEGDEFIGKYDSLLRATGRRTIRDVVSLVDRDVSNPDFWRGSLETIASDIRRFNAAE